MLYRLARALLFLLPAETAHHLGLLALRLLGAFSWPGRLLRRRALPAGGDLSVDVGPVRWPNPVGLAAGLDKDAVAVAGLFALGFGAVEVGTVTPRPQPGNPRPRLFRIPERQALINRMGFNNAGAARVAERLRRVRTRPGPVGINLGKNRDTPLEQATEDYVRGVEELAPLADYVVVNASSPNTPGLRQLQQPELLAGLLTAVRHRLTEVAPGRPLFLKIAPDLEPEAVDEIVDVALRCGVDGLIATNTTTARPFDHPTAREQGGLSGVPLREPATAIIRRAYARAGDRLPILGAGGVFTAEDAYEKIRAGASAVQLYTGLVYGGPGTVKRLLEGLAALLARDGFVRVQEAVGADHRPPALPGG